MKPIDRLMTVSAGALGVLVFIISLRGGQEGNKWELPIGIGALIAGLVAASFVAFRGRTR